MHVRPFLLAGGSASRLWPLAGPEQSKPFLRMFGTTSLFQDTCLRAHAAGFGALHVLANACDGDQVHRELEEIGITPAGMILEPVCQDTAAAAAMAALVAVQAEPDCLVLLAPTDHCISDPARLREAVEHGMAAAARGSIVTFGIAPTAAQTGYGYIEPDPGSAVPHRVTRFIEKPQNGEAQSLCESGIHFWNSGIYLFAPQSLINMYRALAPDILEACEHALRDAEGPTHGLTLDAQAYASARSVSFDHAIVEASPNVVCVPLDADWRDIGDWRAVWQASNHDGDGNAGHGDVAFEDSQNCLAFADGTRLAILGLEGVAAVAVNGTVLVTSLEKAQAVKGLANALEPSEPA